MRIVKGIATVLILAVAAAFAFVLYEVRESRNQANAATSSYNAGSYAEAADLYLRALRHARLRKDRDQVRRQLAQCYIRIGEDPGLALKKQCEWYEKALSYDPQCIDEPKLLRLIETYRGR